MTKIDIDRLSEAELVDLNHRVAKDTFARVPGDF